MRIGTRTAAQWTLTVLVAVQFGVAFAQPPRFGRRGGDPANFLMNLRSEDFRTEMGITEDQQTRLSELQEELREQMGQIFSLPEEERRAKFQEFDNRAVEILDGAQREKWSKKKVELQAKAAEEGNNGPPGGGFGPGGFNGPRPPGGAGSTPAMAPPVRRPAVAEPVPEGAEVSASFATSNRLPAGPGEQAILSFNFRYAPWADVLKLFADAAGLTLDLTDVPTGTFNYLDDRQYTATEALDVLNGYLLPKGFVLIRRDRFLVCVNIDDGIPPNLVPTIVPSELPHRGRNEIVSVVIPLKGMEADKVVGEIRELLGPQGKASALKNTNSLVIQDVGGNVRRIYELVEAGSAIDNRETAFKSIPLKHISAADAERMVRRLFGLNPVTSLSQTPTNFGGPFGGFGGFGGGFGGFPGSPGFSGFSRDGRDSRGPEQPPQPTSSGSRSSSGSTQSPYIGKIQVTADTRTNHLMVTASAELLRVVEEVVQSLDTGTDSSGQPITESNSAVELRVYNVTGDATQIARTLSMLMPGLAIIDDARSSKLHVQATATEHAEISKLIEQFSGTAASSVAVIPLHRLDPIAATNTLRNLFINDASRAPTIEADTGGRRLMVRGTPEQVAQVKALLVELGETGEQDKGATGRGNFRKIPLGGRDPEEFLPLLRQYWATQSPNPIRIVVPSEANPVRDRRVPSDRMDQPANPTSVRPAPRTPERPAAERPNAAQPLMRTASFQQETEQPQSAPAAPARRSPQAADDAFDNYLKSFLDAGSPSTPAKPALNNEQQPAPNGATSAAATQLPGETAPIGISVVGNELVIGSSDEAALDQMEALIENLSAAVPARTRWTLFYLRSADATETAQMLERLFPTSTVTTSTQQSDGVMGSLAGGLSTLGRGMMNATGLNYTLGGQSLRIVTDIRANALFVTGPADTVAEVESMLRILDATELPTSLRDRLPREIAVEHADVEEVAAIIENVFRDAMQAEQQQMQQQRGGGGFNPLAMLMGGAGGGNQKVRGPELTIGIDKRTSHLIVSCNDNLFRQIEDMVVSLDDRARQSRPTVQVVPLTTADPILVSRTLSSLMPKVSVSGTGSRAPRPNTSNTNSQNNGNNNSPTAEQPATPDADAIRRMMEQRFRGDTGGGRGGDSGGRGGFGSGFNGNRGFGGSGFGGNSGRR